MPRLARLLVPAAAAAAALAATVGTGGAQSPAPTVADDPAKPLVYVFSLDAQDGDRAIDQGRAPFLGRLVRGEEGARATYYRESRGIMVSETNPNHTAMVTGAYGERSGIPATPSPSTTRPRRRAARPTAARSTRSPRGRARRPAGQAVVTSGEAATCLQAETFFTALERRAPGIVTAGIFGKPKLARIFETQLVKPVTSTPTTCTRRARGPSRIRRTAGATRSIPSSATPTTSSSWPRSSAPVNEGVDSDGARKRPNLTFVNFPDIDQTGHVSGAREAYETQIMRTDMQIQRFVENQKAQGLWGRTVIFFVSDHSMDTTPPNLQTNSLERVFGDDADAVEVVLNGSVDMVYLKDRNRPDRDALLKRLRDKAVAARLRRRGAVPPAEPARRRRPLHARRGPPGWHIAGERTGDLLVTAKTSQSFGEPTNPLNGNHGAPTTLDHTFAIVSGGNQVRQQAIDGRQGDRFDDTLLNPQQAENVDVAPTVMALFGQAPPAQNQGRVLTEAFTPGTLPRSAARQRRTGPSQAPPRRRATSPRLPLGLRAPRGRGLRFAFARRSSARVQVDVFRQSVGRRVDRQPPRGALQPRPGLRLVGPRRPARRSVGDGYYFARLRIRLPGGRISERRVALVRRAGRFRRAPGFDRAASCALLQTAKLERSVFGGRGNRALSVTFRLTRDAQVSVDVLRRGRVVRRLPAGARRAGLTHRLRLPSERLRRGDYRIRIRVTAPGERTTTATLVARRL
jgi:predicted AlkP superfamily pyrophosphatase or phosphodiesterase